MLVRGGWAKSFKVVLGVVIIFFCWMGDPVSVGAVQLYVDLILPFIN